MVNTVTPTTVTAPPTATFKRGTSAMPTANTPADNTPPTAPSSTAPSTTTVTARAPRRWANGTGSGITGQASTSRPFYAGTQADVDAARAATRVTHAEAMRPNREIAQEARAHRVQLRTTADHEAFEAGQMVRQARFEDIARRVVLGQNVPEIAAAHGLGTQRLRELMRDPECVREYLRVKAEVYADMDKVLFDERMAPLLRARAQAVRAQTLLSSVMQEVQQRIDAGSATPSAMKVGVDAAFGMIDRAGGELAMKRGASVAVNVGVTTGSANFRDGTETLIRATISEAGLDLTDLIPRTTIDATPTPGNDDHSDDATEQP